MNPAILHRIGLDGACVSIRLDDGRIAEITPCEGPAEWQIMPLAVDPHVHLDKSFIWPRARPAAPGLFAAIEATRNDKQFWDASPDNSRSRFRWPRGPVFVERGRMRASGTCV